MKTIKTIFVLALAVICFVACADKTVHTVKGTIVDASMNNVVVASADSTYSFTIEGADTTESNGLLLGAPITVTYIGKLAEDGSAAATKIATDATYCKLINGWVEPNPIAEGEVQGFELQVEGVAKSINMATLVYQNWSLCEDGRLALAGESVGNDQTLPFRELYTIVTLDDNNLVLKNSQDSLLSYTKQPLQ